MPKYIKPTTKTKFHIDFNWWESLENNLRSSLIEHACPECREMVELDPTPKYMDWIDPETGQVFEIDQLWYLVRQKCSDDPYYISDTLPLIGAIFRLFIANNNTPLTPIEIHHQLAQKSPNVILKIIGGRQVYKGLRAVMNLV